MNQDTSGIAPYLSAESTTVEFKRELNFSKAKQWLKTVSAFANTKGGTILVGVTDTKEPVGVSDIKHLVEKTAETINSLIEPVPSYELIPVTENGRDFLIIHILEGIAPPYYYSVSGTRIAFIRTGDESIVAPQHVLNALILRGQHLTFDTLPSPFTLSEVSFTYLNATFHQRLNALPLTEKDLLSFGLVTGDGHLTYAGALLCDQPILDQSRIFCTSWKGLSKGTVGETAFDDKEYAGNLISMLETAELFVSVNSKKSWGISGFFRDDHEEYPAAAVREALINAVIHRDYLISGSEVHVDIFPDRLEITSPGGMMDGSFIQKRNPRDVPSKRRNKVISDIFSRLQIMERRGSGLTRILDAYAVSGKVPVFYSDESTFRVTLPSLSYHPDSSVSAALAAGSGCEVVLSDEGRILHLIRAKPTMTMKEMSDASGLSLKMVRTILQSLRETGVVERVGSQKSGFWKVR